MARDKAVGAIIVALIGLLTPGGDAWAAENGIPLQLAVTVNTVATDVIAGFTLLGRRIGASPADLERLGLQVPAAQLHDATVMLDGLPGLTYKYDEPSQTIAISVDPDRLKAVSFDASTAERPPPAQTGWGAMLNYDVFASSSSIWDPASGTASIALQGRAFSPYGILEQSGILSAAKSGTPAAIRLDTTMSYSDQSRMISYRAGDLISGGLAWSRPIRMAGVQGQSNFALRPDLVTMPLPTLGGTAAVPSTVDIYVNGARTYSQQVNAGPFTLSNVPGVASNGDATVVIKDSSGHQVQSTVPLNATPDLLAPGLSQWSVEAGLPRLSYGSADDSYLATLVGAVSLRHGFSDWATGEFHTEAGAGIADAGVGVVLSRGPGAVAAGALSLSTGPAGTGATAYLSWRSYLYGLTVDASAQGTFGSYEDLASATARLNQTQAAGTSDASAIFTSALPPRRLYRLTLGAPILFDRQSSVAASYIYAMDAVGRSSEILTASYSRSMPFDGSLNAGVFHDFTSQGNSGFFLGLSMPIGGAVSASTSVSGGQNGGTIVADLHRPIGPNVGDFGWHLREAEGMAPYREAGASVRSPYATTSLDVSESRDGIAGTLELRGSIAAMDGDLFFANWIDDGFAVVDAGAPGVEVLRENRPVGVTDGRGKLLVSGLRSYEANNLAIDPVNLPLNAAVGATKQVVAPTYHAGASVKFAVTDGTTSALITFVKSDGRPMPPGTVGKLADGTQFIIGYDGQAFIQNLQKANDLTLEYLDATCHAHIDFVPTPGRQLDSGPVVCT